MRTFKTASGTEAVTTNDEPRPRKRTAEKEIITTQNVDAILARRQAEAEAAKGDDNES